MTESVIRRVRSASPDVRSQALEAIDTIGDTDVARRLLPLLERQSPNPTPDIHAALEELSADADPLIRALAIRCIAEVVEHRWRHVVKKTVDDSSALVRDEAVKALDIVGGDVTQTFGTLSTMDRMLFLRRVELFASLEPDDLQSLAEVATEEVFTNGERIYNAGEACDEMLVIVRGTLQLSTGADGRRHVVSEHGEHQHVGELSVLRSAPRSADVEAADDDVRVLVIAGSQLRHLVADRPHVAQAMLSSLADRLATLIETGPTGSGVGASATPRPGHV